MLLQIDYTFRYYVDDEKFGVSMDHWEEKRDDRIIGRYALLEPGGYIRSVYYTVDGSSGFRSTVQTRMLGGYGLPISLTFSLFLLNQHVL